jgi:FlaG/FlaF family flagellin (archaellin)
MKAKTKGLEPIVAAVLLIVVAVIGAVLVYLWFAGYVTKATSQAEQMAASEKLKIEAASLTTGATTQAKLYIRNLGGDTVSVVHAYVFRPGSISAICSKPLSSGSTINAGHMSDVTITLTAADCPGGSITAGHDYVIKIVTQRGTEFAVTVTASSS